VEGEAPFCPRVSLKSDHKQKARPSNFGSLGRAREHWIPFRGISRVQGGEAFCLRHRGGEEAGRFHRRGGSLIRENRIAGMKRIPSGDCFWTHRWSHAARALMFYVSFFRGLKLADCCLYCIRGPLNVCRHTRVTAPAYH